MRSKRMAQGMTTDRFDNTCLSRGVAHGALQYDFLQVMAALTCFSMAREERKRETSDAPITYELLPIT